MNAVVEAPAEVRCVCGAVCWVEGRCAICGLLAGASATAYRALVAKRWPRVLNRPARAVPPATEALSAIIAVLRVAPTEGITSAELAYRTGLSVDLVYAVVGQAVRGGHVQLRERRDGRGGWLTWISRREER